MSKLNLQIKSKKQIKYKKARALQSKTAKQMAKVYEALEVVDDKGEPNPDMETVIEILTDLRNDQDNLKSYDQISGMEFMGLCLLFMMEI